MIDLIERFQTLIVGIIGFAGVIATLLVNGRLARRQHVQQVKHEREVLRTTLRAELGVLRDTFVHRIEVIAAAQQDGSTGVLIPIDTMTDAYPLLLDRVGLLSVEEARAVMVAYLLVRQMPARIRLLQPKNLPGDDLEGGFACVDGRYFAAMRDLHQGYLEKIEAAISALASS